MAANFILYLEWWANVHVHVHVSWCQRTDLHYLPCLNNHKKLPSRSLFFFFLFFFIVKYAFDLRKGICKVKGPPLLVGEWKHFHFVFFFPFSWQPNRVSTERLFAIWEDFVFLKSIRLPMWAMGKLRLVTTASRNFLYWVSFFLFPFYKKD